MLSTPLCRFAALHTICGLLPLPNTRCNYIKAWLFLSKCIAVHIELAGAASVSLKKSTLETPAFCPLGRKAGVFAFKESLVISARVDDEGFWHKSRFEIRRNTLCISRVSNRRAGTKDPAATADDMISDSLKNGRVFGHRKLFVFRTAATVHPPY